MWFFVICAVVAAALTVALVMGRIDGGLDAGLGEPTSSLAHEPLSPDGPLTDDDIAAVRFDIGIRGYRMNQVDEVIDRLRSELNELRDQVADLERRSEPVGFEPPRPSDDPANLA